MLPVGQMHRHRAAEKLAQPGTKTGLVSAHDNKPDVQLLSQATEGTRGFAGQRSQTPSHTRRTQEAFNARRKFGIELFFSQFRQVRVDRQGAHRAVIVFLDDIPIGVDVCADQIATDVSSQLGGLQ